MANALLQIHRRTVSLPFERHDEWVYLHGCRRGDLADVDLPPGLHTYGPFASEEAANADRTARFVRLARQLALEPGSSARMLDHETWVFVAREPIAAKTRKPSLKKLLKEAQET